MKNVKKFFAACLLPLALSLSGCGGGSAGGAEAGKLSVCASFYVMYDFCDKIGGGRVNLTCLTASGAEPHEWEPAPSDMIVLESADLFVYHGGIEFWAEQALAAVSNRNLAAVRASDAAAGGGRDGDPHAWLDPKLATLELEAIKNAFSAADPENAEFYEANYAAWAEEFDRLDQAYRDGLAGASGKDIVVAHQAFGSLCAAYGLTQVAVEGLTPDSEPSAGRIAEIISLMRSKGIKTVFYEKLSSSKAVDQIAEETGAEAAVLDPIEGLTADEAENGADYVSIMYENLDALKKALN